jgi:N-carbamoyl-L-amino-acid hydrolase
VDLKVDVNRCSTELDRLAQFSDVPAPAVQRVVFTPTDLAARGYLIELFKNAGLKARVDPIGNIFARWEGTNPSLPAVATGSHTDAIPYSGKYDGTVGVLGALEAIRTLQRAQRAAGFIPAAPRRSIELVMFTSEEPTRFAYGCLGSRMLSGQLTPEAAAKLTDAEGQQLDAVRQTAGFSGPLADVQLQPGHYSAFVELHIEQGPLLERADLPIGAVTAIAAPAALRVRYTGPGGHAGGVMMADRHDPLLAAAKLALEVDAAARESGSPDTVGTVGVLDVHPRAINSIPRDVLLEIDVRDIDGPRRDRVLARIQQQAKAFGDEFGVPTTIELINADPPATSDPAIVSAIEQACGAAKLSHQRMVSRAYHDSLFMSLVCPIAMIFIPCKGGVSHRPEEYASPAAIGAGIEVLARTLAQLAQ